jgi:hypothetical protein
MQVTVTGRTILSNAVLHRHAGPIAAAGSTVIVATVLGLWLGLVVYFGARGTFSTPEGAPPFALMAGVVLPLLAFFTGYRLSAPFRAFVLSADLRLLTALQAWRFVGFAFIALYASGILPGVFAWPAGLGDMAIAATAPWLVQALARRPEFVTSKRFVVWNWLGIADLAIAVTAGTLASGLVPALVQGVTTAPMALLPLVLVPAYLVPVMTMFHISALLQARRSMHQ